MWCAAARGGLQHTTENKFNVLKIKNIITDREVGF